MEDKQIEKKSSTAVTTFGGVQVGSLKEAEAWGEEMIKRGFTSLKSGGAVVAAVMMGRELGLDDMMSITNIYPINGRATLGIHLINSLLLKAGIVTEIIRDFEPCVAFAMKGEDGKVYKGEDGQSSPIVLRIGFADEIPKEHEVKGKTIVDFKTVVKMTRNVKQADGTYKPMTVIASFSQSEAIQAKLAEKDNWRNYMKQMCLNRACSFAGRLIGADILLGMYETSEMLDTTNIPYTIQDGKVTIIDANPSSAKSNETFEVVKEIEITKDESTK